MSHACNFCKRMSHSSCEIDGKHFCDGSDVGYGPDYGSMSCNFKQFIKHENCIYCDSSCDRDSWYGSIEEKYAYYVCSTCSDKQLTIYNKCYFCEESTNGRIMCRKCSVAYHHME